MKKRNRRALIVVSILTGIIFLGLEYKLGLCMDFRSWNKQLYGYRNCLITGNVICVLNLIMLIWFGNREKMIGAVTAVMLMLVTVSFILMP